MHEKRIKFLIDENVSPLTAERLEQLGYETIRVSRIKRAGLSDYKVAEYASSSNMIVITLDKDFAKIYHLAMRGKLGILLVRVKPPTVENVNNALQKFLKNVDLTDKRFQKVLFTIYSERYRISR